MLLWGYSKWLGEATHSSSTPCNDNVGYSLSVKQEMNNDKLWHNSRYSRGTLWMAIKLSVLQWTLVGFCNHPLVGNMKVYMTRMGWTKSSTKLIIVIMFWEIKSENYGHLPNYCQTRKNFLSKDPHPTNTCICLSGQNWVASPRYG